MLIVISNNDNPVGQLGIFKEKDFYCKSPQKEKPLEHEYDNRIILGYEYLYTLFSPVYGSLALPYFGSGSTFRIPGDKSYKNKRTGRLSYHSKSMAGDGNWDKSSKDDNGLTVEDKIVLIIGYDLSIKGVIYDNLTRIGINGFGTYYKQPEGTFIHFDTRTKFTHFRKIPSGMLKKAKELHSAFFKSIQPVDDPIIIDDPQPQPEVEPEERTTMEKIEDSKVGVIVSDTYQYISLAFSPEEEDPYSDTYVLVRRMIFLALAIAAISFIIYLIIKFNK